MRARGAPTSEGLVSHRPEKGAEFTTGVDGRSMRNRRRFNTRVRRVSPRTRALSRLGTRAPLAPPVRCKFIAQYELHGKASGSQRPPRELDRNRNRAEHVAIDAG